MSDIGDIYSNRRTLLMLTGISFTLSIVTDYRNL